MLVPSNLSARIIWASAGAAPGIAKVPGVRGQGRRTGS